MISIRMAGIEFRPRLFTSLVTLALLVLMVSLGNWQLRRAAEKRALAERLDARGRLPPLALPGVPVNPLAFDGRPVRVRGWFEYDGQILVDNQVRGGVVGYEVVAPLRQPGSAVRVLVDRGFVPGGPDRARLPAVRPLMGEVEVSGTAYVPTHRFFELSGRTVTGSVWENLTVERYQRRAPWPVQPVVVRQLNDTGDGLLRRQVRPDTGVRMHLGYAVQWYALSATLLVIWGAMNARRIRR